jgi:hypothetical protein
MGVKKYDFAAPSDSALQVRIVELRQRVEHHKAKAATQTQPDLRGTALHYVRRTEGLLEQAEHALAERGVKMRNVEETPAVTPPSDDLSHKPLRLCVTLSLPDVARAIGRPSPVLSRGTVIADPTALEVFWSSANAEYLVGKNYVSFALPSQVKAKQPAAPPTPKPPDAAELAVDAVSEVRSAFAKVFTPGKGQDFSRIADAFIRANNPLYLRAQKTAAANAAKGQRGQVRRVPPSDFSLLVGPTKEASHAESAPQLENS